MGSPFPDQVVLIVGMHRSGTSFLARALRAAGLDLGAASTTPGRMNAKGNHELHDVVVFQELALRQCGGSWDNPPDRVVWTQNQVERLRELLDPYADRPRFGFKDPRTLLNLNGWKSLGCELRFVGIHRSPTAVARSLGGRLDVPLEVRLDLWHRYNSELLALHRAQPFPLLDFDWDPDHLEQGVDDVVRWLDLTGSARDAFDAQLRTRTNKRQERRLPVHVQELKDELAGRSGTL